MTNPDVAIQLLRKHIDPNQSTLELANMCRRGFQMSQEPFVTSMLWLWRAWTIKYLKEKARILIDQGAFVLGVTDEYHTLKGYELDEDERETDLAEIFIQISDPDRRGTKRVITGPCIVARNPSLHPGDVRKVMAVDRRELHHLVDVVVFSQQGERDLPSMLSGGDLDGDDYLVIWDSDVVSNVENNKPMNYFAAAPQQLDRDVEVHDITSFFVNYIKNDRLGSIANAHLAWADRLEEGVKSAKCK
jgi:RNA-dependent RNA polymerase